MSETIPKFRLTVGTWIALIAFAGSAFGAFLTLRNEAHAGFQQHEKRIFRLETRDEITRQEFSEQREVLVRIEERVNEIKRKQDLQRP